MNYKTFLKNRKYSEASGVLPIIDDNFYMKLNRFGLYEERVKNPDKFNFYNVSKVSPNFHTENNETSIGRELYSNIEGINFNKRVGYYLNNYIGHVNEGEIRKNSSSGGFGTWILLELLKNKKIDKVIHVKNVKDSSSNKLFAYGISETREEVLAGAKTKYYPVEMSKVLKIVKESPGKYAVVGIPSFIMAIRLLTKADPIFQERIIFTVGLVCGHQKSSKFTDYMALQSGIDSNNLLDIDYRHKFLDKPADKYGIKLIENDGVSQREIIVPKTKLNGQNWGQGYFKAFASDYTDDVMNETADVTLGDAWLPEYTQDPLGNNIIVVRNPIIRDIIEKANVEGRINIDKVSVEKINSSQDAHFRHTQKELAYRLFKKQKEIEWIPTKRVQPSNKISENRKLIQDLREKISMNSKILYNDIKTHEDLAEFEMKMAIFISEYNSVYGKINFSQASLPVKLKLMVKKILKK